MQNRVGCDLCDKDWSGTTDTGGFIFKETPDVSWLVCPDCEPEIRKAIKASKRVQFVTAECATDECYVDFAAANRPRVTETYWVSIHGCHDATEFEFTLTPEEFKVVNRLAAACNEAQAYACMPEMILETYSSQPTTDAHPCETFDLEMTAEEREQALELGLTKQLPILKPEIPF
jgi:hypothetical protein|tara:strand:- start:13161 stop:13685 length:525 start_codon:yes stop_codon:yes gene_type:complete